MTANHQLTLGHRLVPTTGFQRSGNYSTLLQVGHQFRPNAGAFDAAVQSAVKNDKVTASDIDEIFAAAERELEGTGQDAIDVFGPDLQAFADQWGWAFDEEAQTRLTTRNPHVVIRPATLEAPGESINNQHVEGLFIQAALDEVITAQEVDQLIAAETANPGLRNVTAGLHQRMYSQDGLKYEPQGVAALRAHLGNQDWMNQLDLGRFTEKTFAQKTDVDEAQLIIDEATKYYPKSDGRQNLLESFRRAALARDIQDPFNHENLTPAAKELLEDFFIGTGPIERTLEKFADEAQVTPAAVAELIEQAEWVWGGNQSQAAQGRGTALSHLATQIEQKMSIPYWEHPSLCNEGRRLLDTALFGATTAELRPQVDTRDMFALMFLMEAHNQGNTQFTCGEPEEGTDFNARYNWNAQTSRLRVEKYGELGPLVVERNTVSRGDGTALTAEEVRPLLENEGLQVAIRSLFHRAINTVRNQ